MSRANSVGIPVLQGREDVKKLGLVHLNEVRQAQIAVRPDVFACMPALKARSASPAIYEVNVSRADFLADIAKPEKRGAYAALAEAVYYCCPDGIIEKAEVPVGFGLLCEVAEGQFQLREKARRRQGL